MEPGRKPRVNIRTPLYGRIHPELYPWIHRWVSDRRYEATWHYRRGQPVAYLRNWFSLEARREDADFLMMVDGDAVPTHDPLDFVQRELDVVGFPTMTWREDVNASNPFSLAVSFFENTPDGEIGPEPEVRRVGAGCVLIARRVLEHPAMRAPFMDVFDADGMLVVSEDFNFCDHAWSAGFTVRAAMLYPFRHYHEVDLLKASTARQRIGVTRE